MEPSPQGVLRVVIRRVLVGILTGPFTRRLLSLAALTSSEHTKDMDHDKVNKFIQQNQLILPFSKDGTLREVNVMRILWITASSATGFPASLYA